MKMDEKEDIIIQYEDKSSSIFNIIKQILKNFATVSTIYLFGYFDLSVAWLIAPVVLNAFRIEWKKAKNRKSKAVQMAVQNEKKVILSTIGDLPSWVYFPDIERVEWMNKMLLQLWSNINVYAENMIKTTVQPKIQETLDLYKMSGFEFGNIRLGSIPPRIGGIKVYDKLSRNEIMMDVELIYAGDCNISFYLKGLSGGIKDFQIHGMMRLIMKPLIPIIPFVGGIQIFFLNKPTIDFNLVGAADVLDIPGISDVLRKVIVEQISCMMVLPNKLPIVLSDAIPVQMIKIPEPEGVLRVQIVQATNLMKKDVGVLGRGKSDPYIIITMGAQEFRSQTILNTVNPKWDFWCEFVLYEQCHQKLNLIVFDKDDVSKKDDFLGRATLKFQDILDCGEIDTWLSLEEVKHGMVHIRLMWYNLSTKTSDLKDALEELKMLKITTINTTILIIYLDSLQHLPDSKTNKRPDPVVTITAGHETRSTGVQFKTSCPVYEQGFSFMIHNPKTDSFILKVTDQKTGVELGHLMYHLNTLLEKDGLKHDVEPFQLQKSGNNSKVLFSAQLKILKKSAVKNLNDVSSILSTETEPLISSSTDTEMIQLDEIIDGKLMDETSKDAKSLTNEDSTNSDIKSFSSKSGPEDEVNIEAYKSEEVINSCKWITDQLEPTKQGSNSGSLKGSIKQRKTSLTGLLKTFGNLEMTLNFVPSRQKLLVTIHRIVDLPTKDPTDLPDPYVKIYLLPKTKETKRKTKVIKDTCNPVYEESFEYIISRDEIPYRQLRVTVTSQKTSFISKSFGMGQITLELKEVNLDNNKSWYLLQTEND